MCDNNKEEKNNTGGRKGLREIPGRIIRNIRNTGREQKIIFVLALALAGVITGTVLQRVKAEENVRVQAHLAQEVLRFHILANSDSEADQNLKMTVKEEVLEYLKKAQPEGMDVEETREWMRRHTDEIEQLSREIVSREGFDYPVSAAVTTCYFPEKTYKDITFPKGNYEALRIEIGAAKGHNWWCVLYPNLCFLDAVHAVVPQEGRQKLQEVLTEEEYAEITAETDFKIKWYFTEFFEK